MQAAHRRMQRHAGMTDIPLETRLLREAGVRGAATLDGLREQMNACGHMSNVTLSKEQVTNLVKYLNEEFYHFK